MNKIMLALSLICAGLWTQAFAYNNNNQYAGHQYDGYQTKEYYISCESRESDFRSCAVNGMVRYVDLWSQKSDAPCREGKTWGWDRRRVWTDKGCRATFRVVVLLEDSYTPTPQPPAPVPQPTVQRVSCESREGKFHSCGVNGFVRDVEIESRRSDAPCKEGQTWGWDRNSVWVDKGCRAVFNVYLLKY